MWSNGYYGVERVLWVLAIGAIMSGSGRLAARGAEAGPSRGAAPAAAPGAAAPVDVPGSGASLLWTSGDPAIVRVRELIARGELSAAADLLADGGADRRAAEEGLEVLRRIRVDYALPAEGLFEKLRPQVKDLRPEDLERWRLAGQLQYRTLDGRVAYFRREPSNLWRFCPEAVGRRVVAAARKGERAFTLERHVAAVLAEARRSGRADVSPVRHRVTFALTVPPAALKPGAVVRAWLPFPQEYRQQGEVRLISASPAAPQVAASGSVHRTLYFERRVEDSSKPVEFKAVYEFVTRAWCPVLSDEAARPLPAEFPAVWTAERPPHILFSPLARRTAGQIMGGRTNPLAKAREAFRWVDRNVRYNAEEEYGIVPSLSERGLSRRRGDCGVQGAVFITLCRLAGVPARWQSGWQTLPDGQHNMHDWAEFYVEPWGWLPADPSYGVRESDDAAVREFYFGHLDSYRMIVNLDYGGPLVPEKAALRSEPADFQRGEVEVDGRNLYFDQFEYEFGVEYLGG